MHGDNTMTIEVWLCIALFVSAIINVTLTMFSRHISRKQSIILNNLEDLSVMLVNYQAHLRDIYSMEMFYGDQNLEHLMAHTRDLIQVLNNDYGDISSIEEIENYEEEYEIQEEAETEEDVLHLGTRSGDT